MNLIADILLVAGAMGAAFYCMILSRRLSRFTDLEKGVGGAVAVLSAQVDDMTKTIDSTRSAAASSATKLQDLTERSEAVAKRLELLLASMHDLPGDAENSVAAPQKVPEPAPEPANPPPSPELPVFRRARDNAGASL